MFACFIIGMGLYLILAGTIQERLTRAVRLCEQVLFSQPVLRLLIIALVCAPARP